MTAWEGVGRGGVGSGVAGFFVQRLSYLVSEEDYLNQVSDHFSCVDDGGDRIRSSAIYI